MASNADIPAEGSSVDAPPADCVAKIKEPVTKDLEEDSSASGSVVECTESQIQSILAAAGQGMDDDDEESEQAEELEKVRFTVIYKKQKHEVSWPLDCTVSKLKSHIESLTSVPASLQKIMYK
ncbi:hypothetical protein EGW08_017798, partial [Elysia chlorotica]